MKRIFLLIILATSCFFLARATDYYVDATIGSNTTGNGSSGSPWKTITYALSQITGTGHTLNVAAGTYNTTLGETFPIYVKNEVSLIGSGIDVSIIDADNTNTVLRCVSIVDPSTTIEGFTIRGGGNVESGSGIFISAGSMLNIANNKISGNVTEAWGMGAGIYVENSSPQIINNIITGNEPGAFGDGGGIYINNASPLVKGNRITNNTYYGYGLHITGSTSSPKIANNIIAKNVEGGVYIVSAGPSLINNTISENYDDGIYISSASPDSIFNNIISRNSGYGIYESGSTSDPGKVWYNLFYANSSGLYYDEGTTDYYDTNSMNTGIAECANNIDGDPMFVDRVNDDYHLQLGSPAIDTGDPTLDYNLEPSPNGGRINIGAYGNTTEAATSDTGPPPLPDSLYVDAVSGSNTTGDGSSGTPWQTITYALSQITGTGHTLYVAAGTYNTALGETFPIYIKNAVSLQGAGIDASIIDADNTNSVIRCVSVVDPSTTIEGFTIQGGGNVESGSGIFISAGSMLNIINNKISGNVTEAWGMGAGIYVENSSPQIINNIITGNEPGAFGDGGGIYINNASPLVKGNRITNNTYYGYGLHITGSTSSPKIANNIIAKNVEGGIYIISSGPGLINNTISENGGDGVYVASELVDSIYNNIIAFNTSYGINESGTSADPANVKYNLFFANGSGLYNDEGTTGYYTSPELNANVIECDNNIDGDPLFIDKTNDDYNLPISSPAVDAGDPDPFFNDPDGTRNDIGALTFDYPPAVPQNLFATAGAEKITLRWNLNTEPDLDQYNIYRDLSSPATTLIDSVISTSPPDTFYVDTGLIVGQDYYYRIKAKDIAGKKSDFSGEVMGTPITGLQQDSLALVALYDSTNGDAWTDKSNWLLGNVSTWYEITVSGDRVTEIDLPNNNLIGIIPPEIGNLTNMFFLQLFSNQLSGSIPPEIGSLTNLQFVYLYDNQFTDLPDLSSLVSLNYLMIHNNQFTFKDIEPNIGVASTTYTYSPQDSVGEIIDTTVYVGTSYTMSVSTGGASSQYQWIKDGANIGVVSADSTYTINPVTLSDSGTYTCEITNTVATDLSLYSRPVNVSVPSALSSENDILTYSFVEQTGAATIDAVNHLINIEVANSTDLSNLVASFTISDLSNIYIGTTTQVSGTTANDFTNPVTYRVTAEDGTTQDWVVTVNVAISLSSEKNILTYSFTEQTGAATIDDVNYTVDTEVTNGTDVSALVATYTISDLANITISTTSQVSGVTSNNFTSPVTYTVTAEDGTTQNWVVTVTIATSLSSENDILSFSFAEQTGPATIDDINHAVAIEVALGTDVTGLVATFTISDLANIAVGATTQVSGTTVNDFTSPVTYTVTAENGTTQDWIVTVSEACILIISDFPYSENFESGNGGWRTGGTNSSWEYGIPSAGQTINSAASGNNAWVTDLTGDYNPDEVSYVTSPQFDLSSLNFPKIEFSIWWYAEGFYDGANFQYKLGSGAWKTLGIDEGDDSWYNSSYLYSMENGFGFDMDKSAGWSGDDEWGYSSNGWVTVDHALTGIDYQSANVTFRIAFASNSGYENDGVAFDDINIFDDPTGINDAKILLSDIQIYPNPNEGKFRLVYNGEKDIDLNLQLINLQGQVILSEQIETGNKFSKEFELDYLPPGLYYFRLMHKQGVIVKKMVVR